MAYTDSQIDDLLAHADAHLDESLERLFAFLRIPSISTDPAYTGDCKTAAHWLADTLKELGFDASPRQTGGHPMVVGHAPRADRPNALFYGHYDVQPVDPLNLWNSQPFEPQIIEGEDGQKRIVARGAADDKGQVMTFVEACRTYLEVTGDLPLGIHFLVEGEEESASVHFAPFVEANADELKADMALICDTGMWDRKTPCIFTSLRGIIDEEMEITCAGMDLHSGGYGSAALNPIQVLANVIASLRNPDGSVAIAGFYDDVEDVPDDVKAMWDTLGFDEKQFLGKVGLTTPAGEQDRSVLEQITSRPTCEINGIIGGYTGQGGKTVIPSKASAKLTFRLVAGMEPQKIRDAFRDHVRAQMPTDAKVEFFGEGGASAVSIPFDSPVIEKASLALAAEWGVAPVLRGGGGSIPAVEAMSKTLGLDPLLVGFGRDDDRVHSPNEKYDLESFHKGIRSWIRILAALA